MIPGFLFASGPLRWRWLLLHPRVYRQGLARTEGCRNPLLNRCPADQDIIPGERQRWTWKLVSRYLKSRPVEEEVPNLRSTLLILCQGAELQRSRFQSTQTGPNYCQRGTMATPWGPEPWKAQATLPATQKWIFSKSFILQFWSPKNAYSKYTVTLCLDLVVGCYGSLNVPMQQVLGIHVVACIFS